MHHWFLIQTRVKQEKVAEENLRHQGFNIFLPTIKMVGRRAGHWQDVEEPLFPGYLFIYVNQHQQNIAPIRSTKGVLKLVRFGTELQPVPDVIVDEIKQRLEQAGSQPAGLPLKKGDKVWITEGSFKGMVAIFETESGSRRVELLLEMLGRYNKITLGRDEIGPAE